jgi:hypothetical protein
MFHTFWLLGQVKNTWILSSSEPKHITQLTRQLIAFSRSLRHVGTHRLQIWEIMINGWPLGKNKMKYVYKFHNFYCPYYSREMCKKLGKRMWELLFKKWDYRTNKLINQSYKCSCIIQLATQKIIMQILVLWSNTTWITTVYCLEWWAKKASK